MKTGAKARGFTIRSEPERAFLANPASLGLLAIDAGILATAAGDRQGFAALFEQMAPRAKAYLIGRGLGGDVAEELAIEAMVQVWHMARSFDPAAESGHAWLFQRLREVTDRAGELTATGSP